ncbi:methyltransferase [Thalassotalea sp. 1_MG-2023]|uniref:methyltransferase n=1 Tax=Thalassotalea sp. 1_MG-2023 TaxID=3062680 RepID=UPI0026E40966|nr:methyltransferase [Thalassotalea sp. 1_MG-2023]MDO6428638.1 methyltransferase [Thalassotalea sp. 1_MG-2023]
MISPFIVNDQNLFLERYPANQVTRSLQAWDSADEYIINYLQESALITPESHILVMNDSYGAISLNFPEHHVTSVSDSYISECGLKKNAEHNHLSLKNLTQINSLAELPAKVDVVLYKIPKSNNLLKEQLQKIRQAYQSNIIFIAADKAKNIHSNTLKFFERYLGATTTSLAVKKSRLVFSKLDAEITDSTFPRVKRWKTEPHQFEIINHANVFARDKLDIGAQLLLSHLPTISENEHVIDLGCGNGVLGLHLLAQQSQAKITFSDESYMAVASAHDTVKHNYPQLLNQCRFMVNDCLTDESAASADSIVCNPPFHQQNATTDHIAWQMFNDCYRVLKQGGKLTIVGNRQLGYHIKLKRIFGNATLVASNKKFVIFSATK